MVELIPSYRIIQLIREAAIKLCGRSTDLYLQFPKFF